VLILNSASIGAEIMAFWREIDSTEVVYTWDAMIERTVETYNADFHYGYLYRVMLAMAVYHELEDNGRLN
jgi:hypothetical protein